MLQNLNAELFNQTLMKHRYFVRTSELNTYKWNIIIPFHRFKKVQIKKLIYEVRNNFFTQISQNNNDQSKEKIIKKFLNVVITALHL